MVVHDDHKTETLRKVTLKQTDRPGDKLSNYWFDLQSDGLRSKVIVK